MDQDRRSLIVTAAVGLLVLAIIIGSIYFLIKFIRNRQTASTAISNSQISVSPSASTATSTNSTPISTLPNTNQNNNIINNFPSTKTFNVEGLQITYPNKWGLLTCTNSKNFEFDINNGADNKVLCDVALKPVTVILTNNLNCPGEHVKLGDYQVVRSANGTKGGGEVDYRWCIVTDGMDLDITHRVSQSSSRATSKNDVSVQIEQLISQIKFSRGS